MEDTTVIKMVLRCDECKCTQSAHSTNEKCEYCSSTELTWEEMKVPNFNNIAFFKAPDDFFKIFIPGVS